MISIVDYGMGNLQSVMKALASTGTETKLITTPEEVATAEKLVLPGVGAFGDAMEHLNAQRMVPALRDYANTGRPMLGICLGMQLFFDKSEEDSDISGLGIFSGVVTRFPRDLGLKVPHMGWNTLKVSPQSQLLAGLGENPYVYFVHSYYVAPTEPAVTAATTSYGMDFVSAVERGSVSGVQFHPEKSQTVGLRILRNFANLK